MLVFGGVFFGHPKNDGFWSPISFFNSGDFLVVFFVSGIPVGCGVLIDPFPKNLGDMNK